MNHRAPVALLGPQRLRPFVASVLDDLGVGGRIAAITAGWQEREDEDDELHEHCGKRSINLRLYRRTEKVFSIDPELRKGFRERQARLRDLQGLYRVQLNAGMDALRELDEREGPPDLLRQARDAAVEALQVIDRRHLETVEALHAEFEATWKPMERESLAAEREHLRSALADCEAVAVAGGHVVVLLNRLRLLGVAELMGELPLVAWSAGAMAVSDRVILFHDSPPQGPGYAEVLENGLGLCPGVVPLPHARNRLRLDDPGRVSRFSRRFHPASCVALDEGSRIDWSPTGGWSGAGDARRLERDGAVAQGGVA